MGTGEIFYLRHFKSYRLNHISYIEWAIKQLENGNEFDELYELAGLYRNAEYSELEIEQYFSICISKLGIKNPQSQDEALIIYCCYICNFIIEKCSNIESLTALVGELTSNIEDYLTEELEPLWNLSVDLAIVEHNGKPMYYKKMNKENAVEIAKEISMNFIEVNA